MTFYSFLPFASSVLCCALALSVAWRARQSFVHRVFALGMVVLAVEEALAGMGAQAYFLSEAIWWQKRRLVVEAFHPGVWLLFSVSFSRANYKESVARWLWVVLAVFVTPPVVAVAFREAIFALPSEPDRASFSMISLGWPGYVVYLLLLLSTVLILVNLERTLRASTGSKRWRIKFMVLGLSSLFGIQVYTISQTLLFSAVNPTLETVKAAGIILSCLLITISLIRNRMMDMDVYVSDSLLFRSLTLVIIGIYLISVGALVKAGSYFTGAGTLLLNALIIFFGLLGLAIFLLSDQVRLRFKRSISRHFGRPQYDYRDVWMSFTQRTTSLIATKDLCATVCKMVAEIFGVSSVTIWFVDERQQHLAPGGSTFISEAWLPRNHSAQRVMKEFIHSMRDQKMPVDLENPAVGWAPELRKRSPEYFKEARIRYCVTLSASKEFLGLMSLNDRVAKEAFSVEDFDLLKTIADQAAASLLNLKLSESLLQAKGLEALQSISAFFIHDLKNLASTLSLTLQNLPTHFDHPLFREDALRSMSRSVEKINAMSRSLSMIGKKTDLVLTETDLNELVSSALRNLNGALTASLIQDLHQVPKIVLDQTQVERVVINLVLNANEAMTEGGEIQVATEQQDGWVVLSVKDNGSGIPKEFMAWSLFKPFQTTKTRGFGIGLFQCKKIIEAHRGRIEVESEEGKGSTFRVLLPVAPGS